MCIHERQLLLKSFLFNYYFYFFADLRGVVLRNVFRIGGLCAFTGGGTSCGENAGQYVLVL